MNKIYVVLLFVVYIVISCLGLFMIKLAPSFKSAEFAGGFFLYGLGAALWMIILRQLPLSLAFPVAAGSLIIGTMLVGVFFLNEAVPLLHVFGAGAIIFGIYLIVSGA